MIPSPSPPTLWRCASVRVTMFAPSSGCCRPGELVFFSAIDEGVILTITEPRDLASHLASELARLREPAEPAAVLAFDCILRRIESQEKQMTTQVSALLRQNGVIGFSTYGEQIGPMHVNQTMTGIAFYPPGTTIDETDA